MEENVDTPRLTSLCYIEKDGRYLLLIRVTIATNCDEGELVWLKKAELLTKKRTTEKFFSWNGCDSGSRA